MSGKHEVNADLIASDVRLHAIGCLIRTMTILCLVGSPLCAQATTTADAITTDEVAHHLHILSGDSMQGRDTPSPSLERAAVYLAGALKSLASGGRDTAWVQRYQVPGHFYLDWAQTKIDLSMRMERRGKAIVPEGGNEIYPNVAINFVAAARPAVELADLNWLRRTATRMPVRLVAGAHTSQSVRRADLRDSYVVYVPPAGLDSTDERQIVDALLGASRGVLVIADEDSLTFARRLQAARQRPFRMVDHYMSGRMGASSWGAYVWLPAVRDAFRAADVDLAAARAATQPVVTGVPSVYFDLNPAPDTTRAPFATAPNVVAVLEGSDPKLKDEYVVFTAHLDADSDGRGDNAAGMAGLLALAKAFGAPAARPKRSLVFLATSGATKDWWGARSFVDRFGATSGIARRVVASLHLDAIDQVSGDSLGIDGLRDFAASSSPAWVGPAHPELGVTVVEGGAVDRSPANLGAYLVRVRPSLAFHAARERTPIDRPNAFAAPGNVTSRVLRLIFYLGYDLANTTSRLGWSTEGRNRLRQAMDDE